MISIRKDLTEKVTELILSITGTIINIKGN